ncbi:MAG: PEP-CTERM sorting domain-containing protein [Syntrophobacterales bacterium]|jgi:hypothetical protein|nr:PEP-CTERM sorting domain-containing protein [Syntrophobacterales bacterium]
MRKLAKSMAAVAAGILIFGLLGLSGAQADYGSSITIYDTMVSGGTGTWYNRGNTPPPNGGGEDNEVEYYNETGQRWDLEGFYLKQATLTMVGGFDFKNGESSNGVHYDSGDIFISSGTPLYGAKAKNSADYNYSTISNKYGYNYVIHLDFDNDSFTCYAIDADSQVMTVEYNQADNTGSNPYRYVSGGSNPQTGSMVFTGPLTSSKVNANIIGSLPLEGDGTDDNHYVVTIDLSNLLDNGDYFFHYTYGCGNDLLMGSGTLVNPSPIPVPSTLLLLGTGVLGLAGLRWRRRQA